MAMSDSAEQALLNDVRLPGDEHYALIEPVRALVRRAVPSAGEAVRYGDILFLADVIFAGVFACKAHVSVEFSHGAKIDDRWGYLDGSGKFRRHVKLMVSTDIEDRHLADYLPLALEATRE